MSYYFIFEESIALLRSKKQQGQNLIEMKNSNNILLTLLFSCLSVTFLHAQDQGFIYGKITTIDGKSFEGPIRWGKEEVYWTDLFNASKETNKNIDYLTRDELRDLDERYRHANNSWGEDWGNRMGEWFNIRWDNDTDFRYEHQFVCQFGEIKTIKPTGRERAEIRMQSGKEFEVDGSGYNDVATKVKIRDKEIGEIEVQWSRIDMVEFMSTPNKLDDKFGDPLYGTVETYAGTFVGYVQWDHDERVSEDKLDGDTDDGDVSIEFGKLKSIEKQGFRSRVVLNSGREMDLRGSNDVNSDNRGIVLTSDEYGRLDIPWREFKKVTFESSKGKMKSYNDFSDQKELTASVKIKSGETLKGKLVFDLDEEYNYEVLHGKSDDIEYLIHFRNVNKLTPKNYDNSTVELKSGKTLLLGDAQDVSERNTGLLVFADDKRPTYIIWDDVEEIIFN